MYIVYLHLCVFLRVVSQQMQSLTEVRILWIAGLVAAFPGHPY